MSEEGVRWFARATITRWVDDDPQPGIVECRLDDAAGRSWFFIGKYYDFTQDELRATSQYPRRGYLACDVTARRRDDRKREIASIDTDTPDRGRDSEEGMCAFDILADQLVADALPAWQVLPLVSES
ncbi:MAG: hypothetical protein JOZ72_10610 [Alphaproteobacteria bacterium]|nr:hypothetical protein [Alphaproteobacteria bacterium]